MSDFERHGAEDPAAAPDFGAYFERISCEPPARPSLAALAAMQWAHTASVPFENLDILLGRPIRLDLPSLFAKIVGARRTSICTSRPEPSFRVPRSERPPSPAERPGTA